VSTITPRGVRLHGRTGAATMAALSVLATGAVVVATQSSASAAPVADTIEPIAHLWLPAPALAGPAWHTKRGIRPTASTLAADSTSVKLGQQVVLSGSLTGANAKPVVNHPVRLEASTGGDWMTVASQLVNPDGTVSFVVEPAKTTKYRLTYAGVGTLKAAISAEQDITVKQPPPPPPPPVVRTVSTSSSSSSYSYTANTGSIGSAGVPASGSGAAVVAAAAAEAGKPYVFAAAGPNAFDCSGLTMYVFAQFGVSLPHDANAQQRYGTPISADQAAPGDLMVFLDGGYGYHAGIYAGGGLMWDAPNSGSTVGLHQIWSTNVVFRRLV
jgi:cell wall-associated NlpC family hydrolase